MALGGLPPRAILGLRQRTDLLRRLRSPAYDSYAFAYQYPLYTGGQVTAVAVHLCNSRFRHRQVVGPGVAWYGSQYPRTYRVHRYW